MLYVTRTIYNNEFMLILNNLNYQYFNKLLSTY